jgi:hypothetical protein
VARLHRYLREASRTMLDTADQSFFAVREQLSCFAFRNR